MVHLGPISRDALKGKLTGIERSIDPEGVEKMWNEACAELRTRARICRAEWPVFILYT